MNVTQIAVAEKTGPSRKAGATASHQPVFDPPLAARQDQHSYIPYLSDLTKNTPAASV